MRSRAGFSTAPTLYLSLISISFLIATAILALMAWRSGYSAPRVTLAGLALLLSSFTAWAALRFHKKPGTAQLLMKPLKAADETWLRPALGCTFLILWGITWFPPQYMPEPYSYYLVGLYPLLLCALFGSGLALIFVTATAGGFPVVKPRKSWIVQGSILNVTLISLAAFAGIALLTRLLNILRTNEPYWRGASVPILAWQVLLSVIIGVLWLVLEDRLPRLPSRANLILFALVWIVAALFWSRQSIPEHFWVTGPRPPNHEYYPFSDSETYDLGSQFALIGQGIFNRQFWDRALYMSFLVYLHAVGGQDYQQLMSIQAALFAVFPALLFLLGCKLHSRQAGLILAAITVMRGLNSLAAAPLIHSSTFKNMLTEFPTALGLVLFTIFMLKWLEHPERSPGMALGASGVLGLTSLLRPHVLVLFAASLVVFYAIQARSPRRGLITAGLALLAFLLAIGPWMIFGSGSHSPLVFYGRRIQDVIHQRYPQFLNAPAAGPAAVVQPSTTEALGPEGQAGPPTAPATESPAAPAFPTPRTSAVPFPVLHYIHNLVSSPLSFPSSPRFLTLADTVKRGEDVWQLRWRGEMSTMAAGMLMLNLACIALGLAVARRRLGWPGLLPMAVFLIYHSANALARTSGGRYLVPPDWALVLYYSLGIAELLTLAYRAVSRTRAADLRPRTSKAAPRLKDSLRQAWVLGAVVLMGSLVPIAGTLYPQRYASATPEVLAAEVRSSAPDSRIASADLDAFLTYPGAVVLKGRALYPRFYRQGTGVDFALPPFQAHAYPRTVFDLIGPHGLVYVLLAGDRPSTLPNASDAVVLGCEGREGSARVVQAIAVVLPATGVTLDRTPASPLQCPLPELTCADFGGCD